MKFNLCSLSLSLSLFLSLCVSFERFASLHDALPTMLSPFGPAGAILRLSPPGYVTPEELQARIQQRNEDKDDPSWGTVEDIKTEAAESDIGDITFFPKDSWSRGFTFTSI